VYNKILSQEEMLWYQKSRENWVKYGNKNTKFFHTQTIIRRRRNKISGLNVENIWCTDAGILKREASKFFRNLFQSNDPCNHQSLQLHNIPSIGMNMQEQLLLPITEE
jgi:hypothetical protein